jgi:hypothetical protein
MPNQQPGVMPGQVVMVGTGQQRHPVPRCLSCGTVTPWRLEPILLARHIIIFVILLFFFGAGLLYLLLVLIIRSGSNARAKICPRCGARNLWTFIY